MLRLLFTLILALLFAWFAATNWSWVTIRLPGDTLVNIRLPLLLALAALLGALPVALSSSTRRWRLRRRLARAERELAAARAPEPPPPPPVAQAPHAPA